MNSEEVDVAADAMWAAIDDTGIRGRLYREDCLYLAQVLAKSGLLARHVDDDQAPVSDGEWVRIPADQVHEEWMAAVGWRNGIGQTEQNQGYGDTREAALADARSQPRLLGLGDEDEVAHKALRRLASSWEEA
ncbi:hypothetical protein M3C36_06425 [Dietzia cinnamea]|uniref:hypothetical protein n=1 Tax=Dietzia TaxID=37914 RepID=UPI000D08F9D4|nr:MULTISPECIES: hypothetical protein [Dietzia]AVM66137.1 hypothetical protein C3V38_16400 [Dietzia sp. oral taxon 368]MCT1884821.1 hypothetical protein [Dietzia cinnamea]